MPEAVPGDVLVTPMDVERDLAGVLAVDEASFVNHWTREMFLWEAQNSDVARVFVLRVGTGPVVAYCAAWFVFDQLHINNLAVLPDWRRRHLAWALLDHVLRAGQSEGAVRATLEVRASNAAALALYGRAGFQIQGRRVRYYTNPVEDALILWREDGGPLLETPRDE